MLEPRAALETDAALEDGEPPLEPDVDVGADDSDGGIVATFIESFVEPTLYELMPTLYARASQARPEEWWTLRLIPIVVVLTLPLGRPAVAPLAFDGNRHR